jgi:hypothetical protein
VYGECHKPREYSWKLLQPFTSCLFLWSTLLFLDTFSLCSTANVRNQINFIVEICKSVLCRPQNFFTDNSVIVLTELQNGLLGSHRLMSPSGRGSSPEVPDHVRFPPKLPSNLCQYDWDKNSDCVVYWRVMSVIYVLIVGYWRTH